MTPAFPVLDDIVTTSQRVLVLLMLSECRQLAGEFQRRADGGCKRMAEGAVIRVGPVWQFG